MELRSFNSEYYGEKLQNKLIINNKKLTPKNNREVELYSLALGNNLILDENKIEWDYRNPNEVLPIINNIDIPKLVKKNLVNLNKRISREYVHKEHTENILISEGLKDGNIIYFKGFEDSKEIIIDHESDHIQGIKIFEAIRQATLASFHLMGVQTDKIMAITNIEVNFKKFIEKNRDYYIQVIPACRIEGGAMFTVFKIIQDDSSCVDGFFEIYTFRDKKAYMEKRKI